MQIAMHKNKVILYWPTQINWQKFEKIPGLLEIFTKRELIFSENHIAVLAPGRPGEAPGESPRRPPLGSAEGAI